MAKFNTGWILSEADIAVLHSVYRRICDNLFRSIQKDLKDLCRQSSALQKCYYSKLHTFTPTKYFLVRPVYQLTEMTCQISLVHHTCHGSVGGSCH